MFFLICNRIDCYITINTFEHVVFDLSDTPYSSTFPHKFTFYRVFARKKLNWEFQFSTRVGIFLRKSKNLESPLSTADAMRDIQILFRKSPNGRIKISFQTHILTFQNQIIKTK